MNLPQAVPTLETARLQLRAFSQTDAPAVFALMQDGKISENTLLIPNPYTLEDALSWIKSHTERAKRASGFSFAVTLRSSGDVVGGFGLHPDLTHAHAEIGYWVGTAFWGQGFAAEAGRAILDWAFAELALERVHAHVFAGNTGSVRVQEKMGMTLEGRLRNYYRKNGVLIDSEMRSILRSEWQKAKT
jgi:[ribosomal protein S5]-alanine N-acetyltransferase